MLYDSLEPLHHGGAHARFLLTCAGMLHDIGWVYGQAGHNRQGAEMILSDGSLPFDLAERGNISLVAFSHRGSKSPVTHPYFTLLSPADQRLALVLSALLRVADGLDYQHTGSVQEIHCIITRDEIVCDIVAVADTDVMPEKERARKKSDLFTDVFGRGLVIR